MNDKKKELVDVVIRFLKENNIEPIYFFTLVCLIIVLGYKNEFRNWKKLESWRKGLASSALFAAIVFLIISLLKIFGIIDL